jgi:hypothetical protein
MIRSIHPETLRNKILTEVTQFIERKRQDPDGVKSVTVNPIFHHTMYLIQLELQTRQFGQSQRKQVMAGGRVGREVSQEMSQRQGMTKYPPQFSDRSEKTERAAEACDEASSVSASSQKYYSGEVPKSTQPRITVFDGKRSHTYVAVRKKSSICTACYPERGVASAPHPKPCFDHKCKKCGFYGHKEGTCLQTIHAETGESVAH